MRLEGSNGNGSKHRIYRPGAKATSRGQFDKAFDRGSRLAPEHFDALLQGEVEYGKKAAEDREARAMREATARAAELAIVPKGATHRILSGDYTDQYVCVLDSDEGLLRVAFVGGPRNGAIMYLPPFQLAKPGETSYDVELEAKLSPGKRAFKKSGRTRTDYYSVIFRYFFVSVFDNSTPG